LGSKRNYLKKYTYDKQRTPYETILESFLQRGYTLLSTDYSNNKLNLDYICPKGHKGNISWNSWTSGRGCRECGHERTVEALKLSYGEVKALFEKEDYKLITKKYRNNKQKLEYICPNGHRGCMRLDNFMSGARCGKCHTSKAELEVLDFVSKYFKDTISRDREIIKPYELDIVVPSKKIAIEYNGLYWHNDRRKKKGYHLNKLTMCEEAGYTLITIFEDEFKFKKEIVLSRLKNILGVSDGEKIGARKCLIREIDTKLKNRFLNKHHIQGADRAKIKLGAFYDDKLVSVMTFSAPSVSKGAKRISSGDYELSRFCSDYKLSIVGIASKLFKYFVKNYDFNFIFTYSDRRWSTGNLYKNLGFEHISTSVPNYWYIVEEKRVHRYNFRKDRLKKMLMYDKDLTEIAIMKKSGFTRIFDCGNMKWGYQNA